MIKKKNKGFTLVEVLICVGIIGIIAAISIPALLTSTSSKALEVQRKALYSRMAQAFGQIKNLKAYNYGRTYTYNTQQLVNALALSYKIGSICRYELLDDCGIPATINDYYSDTQMSTYPLTANNELIKLNSNLNTDVKWGGQNTATVGFKTANGESILLYYNPKCKSRSEVAHDLTASVCVNMIYDLNGKSQAPNAYGEDIGYITVFYPTDSVVVMPMLYNKEAFSGTFKEMFDKASEMGLVPPSQEELISVLINKDITHITSTGEDALKLHWSSTYSSTDASEVWVAGITDGVKKVAVSPTSTTSYPYYLLKK